MPDKPLASISLDLDDLWTYLRTHGESGWEERPSYLTTFIPMALDLLAELELLITFFVVGADGERDENADALRSLAAAGHEIGNHTYEHEPWLHLYSRERLQEELERSERSIVRSTGQLPRGFRGPGYSWSPALLDLLARRGYLYDASTLPTYLGPLARAYYFRTARLGKDETATRSELFGTLADGLRPSRPYWWRLAEGRTMLEIPVTTFPGIKTPFHMSYLLFLARYSERLAMTYLVAAATACRISGGSLSFLLHPLDLLDGSHAPRLAFFPGMGLDHRRKRELVAKALRLLRDQFTLVPMGVHAQALRLEDGLKTRQPARDHALIQPSSLG